MQADDICVAFHQETIVIIPDSFLRMRKAIEDFALDIYFRFRRIDILRTFLRTHHLSPCKSNHLSGNIENGEHDPMSKKITTILCDQTRPLEDVNGKSCLFSLMDESVCFVWGITKAKRFNRFSTK